MPILIPRVGTAKCKLICKKLRVFWNADFESEIIFSKFKMEDLIWLIEVMKTICSLANFFLLPMLIIDVNWFCFAVIAILVQLLGQNALAAE